MEVVITKDNFTFTQNYFYEIAETGTITLRNSQFSNSASVKLSLELPLPLKSWLELEIGAQALDDDDGEEDICPLG